MHSSYISSQSYSESLPLNIFNENSLFARIHGSIENIQRKQNLTNLGYNNKFIYSLQRLENVAYLTANRSKGKLN